MKTKILKIQKSNRPIWETGLTSEGTLNLKIPLGDAFIENFNLSDSYSCEMVIHLHASENSIIPLETIILKPEQHANIISKYGMEALLKGVEILSLFDIAGNSPANNSEDHFKKEIESIAYSIVARMEQDTFFNNYNPNDMRQYIENKLIGLRDRFKIEPK